MRTFGGRGGWEWAGAEVVGSAAGGRVPRAGERDTSMRGSGAHEPADTLPTLSGGNVHDR